MSAHRGHLYVLTRRPGVPRKLFVHRAVLMAHVGPPPEGQTFARHLNDTPNDNRVENLAWGSAAENAADAARNGRIARGERTGTAKLSEADVIAIRRRHPGESLRALAREYGVSHTAIRRAANGMKWSHL